jgi:hypothetical protein
VADPCRDELFERARGDDWKAIAGDRQARIDKALEAAKHSQYMSSITPDGHRVIQEMVAALKGECP